MEENELRNDNVKIKVEKPKKIKERKRGNSLIASIITFFIGAVCMYLFVYYVVPIDNSSTIINKSEKEVTITETGIADAVDKLYDAVVVVELHQNGNIIASGTGFVYATEKDKAYILTNNHVVSAAGKASVRVQFTDGREEDVKIEGTDEYSDLAVLSLDADKIVSVAEVGKTDVSRLGDTVFTIGAPLDTEYYWTVTRGVLSGKDRMVEVSLTENSSGSDYVMRVLQTDASINSGNSGGPLANSNGEVIGITNMKLVSEGVEGIGFAIPIEDAIKFADAIIKGEEIKKPLLGVSMLNLSDRYYLYQEGITLNTTLTSGVVAVKIQEDSPADKAGIKRGDIITSLAGEEVKNVAQLRYVLYKQNVGDTVEVKFEREGKMKTAKIKLTVASE